MEMSLGGSNTDDRYAVERLVNWANHKYGKSFTTEEFQGQNPKDIHKRLLQLSQEFLDDDQARGEGVERDFIRQELTELERFILLHEYDSGWKEHLLSMDHLRDSIGLRGYAERDPKIEYTREGSRLFEEMLESVQSRVTDLLFKVKLKAGESARSVYNIAQTQHDLMQTDYSQEAGAQAQAAEPPPVAKTIQKDTPKVGRNDPCPCRSGKKYKKCCGKNI
jgi:preprotein translocase subunit SecA